MPSIPAKVFERLQQGMRRFQPILSAAKSRDAGEADTSTIVKDMLSEVFGFDKYAEITSEYAIKGTYCDLAVRLEGKLHLLIEVKAIGLDLKDAHTKQAVDYAANQGVEWVVLTNGAVWRIYRVVFGQPISQELVFESDMLSLNTKLQSQVDQLFLLAREGQSKSVLEDYHAQKQATNRYFLGALILSDAVLDVIRRELRRLSPGIRIETDEIQRSLIDQVLKRDLVEGEKFSEARKRVGRAQTRSLRARRAAAADGSAGSEIEALPGEAHHDLEPM